MRPRPWARRAVLLVTLLCLSLMVFALNLWVRRPPELLAGRLAGNERHLLYRLMPGQPLRFSLGAGLKRVRLLSHLVVGPPTLQHPGEGFLYPLRLRQERKDGTPLWAGETHVRTRLPAAARAPGSWRPEGREAAEVRLTESRAWEVELVDAAEASQLWLELPAAQGEVWVALLVPAEEKGPRSRRLPRWEHLAASATGGTAPETRAAMSLGVQDVPEALPALLVGETRPAAVPVMGPAHLVLGLATPDGQPAPGASVTASLLGPTGPLEPTPGSGAEQRLFHQARLTVPPGLHSLELRTDAAEPLSVLLTPFPGLPERLWLPLRQRLPAFASGPGCPQARLQLEAGAAGVLRVSARGFLSAQEVASFLELGVTAEDGQGRVLVREGLRARRPFAPFERVHRPLPHPSHRPCEDARATGSAPLLFEEALEVSEPADFYVRLPPGAEQVTLHASVPVLLSAALFFPEPGAPGLEPPFAEAQARAPWRHAPMLRRQWQPLRPFNLEELELSTGALSLEVQTRREPRQAGPAEASGASRAAEPHTSPERQLLLEPVLDPASLVGGWEPGAYTLLSGEEPVVLDFDARTPEAPAARYALPLDALESLGASVELRQDDTPWRHFRLLTPSGRESLPALPPGRHRVAAFSSARALRVLVNRLPAPGEKARVFRTRTVHALRQPLTVAVSRPEATPMLVTAVLYATAPGPLEQVHFRLRVDGGQPRRGEALLLADFTPPEREGPLPAATGAGATFLQRTRHPPLHARAVGIVLGNDLAPGPHTVTLEARGGRGLWARFLLTPLPAPAQVATRAPDGALELARSGTPPGEDAP